MKIGIIGTGKMGSSLGRRWAQAGHSICFGSRNPSHAQPLVDAIGKSARVGTIAEAGDFGEVVVLAVPWFAVYESVRMMGPLGNRVLVDCTNPYLPGEVDPAIAAHGSSGAEKIARWLSSTTVVKAFNTIYWQHIIQPEFTGGKEVLFMCSDDISAKGVVARLGRDIGFEPMDAGPLSVAHALEAMGYLWTQLAFHSGQGPNFAFTLLRR